MTGNAHKLFAEGSAQRCCWRSSSARESAERLAGGNAALALLANTLATVGGLYVLVELLGPVSGAHFNPAVSLVMAARGALPRPLLAPYVTAQLLGAMLGAWLAHAMFDATIVQFSTRVRSGTGQWIAEAVAAAGLLLVILRAPPGRVAALVACYIGAAYWYTASTSFANPAAAFGRMFNDSYAGIAPASVPGFVIAELVGAAIGAGLHQALGSGVSRPVHDRRRRLGVRSRDHRHADPAGHRLARRRPARRHLRLPDRDDADPAGDGHVPRIDRDHPRHHASDPAGAERPEHQYDPVWHPADDQTWSSR